MPKQLDNLVKKLKAQGYDDKSAWAIATSQLQKSGVLKNGMNKPGKVKKK